MLGGSRNSTLLGILLLISNLLTAGCSSVIVYSGQDIEKLVNKDQVHDSFGMPTNLGNGEGCDFEEYRTHRKISEPTVASVNFILGTETLGLFELWNFPGAILQTTWTTLVGQTLRFEYGSNGAVSQVLINGTAMKDRASLP